MAEKTEIQMALIGAAKRFRPGIFGLLLCLLTACGSSSSEQTPSSVSVWEAIPEDAVVTVVSEQAQEQQQETVQEEATQVEAEPFTMVFTGDVLLQENITAAYNAAGGLTGILSDTLIEELNSADLTMVNEEFPFGTGGEPAEDKQYTFRVDPSYVNILLEMGTDIVSLANNHVLDYGQSVLSQTFTTLDEAGIAYVGAGETLERAKAWESFEINGTSIAILSSSRVIPVESWDAKNSLPGVFTTYDSTLLNEQIELADDQFDLVIVYVHWGVEKAEYPEDYQQTLAKEYIDHGADLVIGGHPHVLQGLAYYNGVPIIYSLGNFLFNQTISSTVLMKVTVDSDLGLTIQMIPASAVDSKTSDLTGSEGQAVLEYLESISYDVTIDENGYIASAL